jgi:hypothetical protein
MLQSEILKKYNSYNVFGIHNTNNTKLSLGQFDISLRLNGNTIRLNTIYYPSEEAKKWLNENKERLVGISGLKPIHKYNKNYFFTILENDKTNLLEKIKNMGFLYILDIQINEITKKIRKRLNKEYSITVDGYNKPV